MLKAETTTRHFNVNQHAYRHRRNQRKRSNKTNGEWQYEIDNLTLPLDLLSLILLGFCEQCESDKSVIQGYGTEDYFWLHEKWKHG